MKFISLLLLLLSFRLASQDHHSGRGQGWKPLFNNRLSDAIFPDTVWTVSNGILTASRDECIWSADAYDDFVLDLEFKTADGTNSGVIVHATDTKNWIPHSVEIQIADDYSAEWSKAPPSWQCGAIFGHQPATIHNVRKPGEWNHMVVSCKGAIIRIELNGKPVNTCDMRAFTSAVNNPDGSTAPAWLSTPMASLPLHGHIGLQGKHAGQPIYFRRVNIKTI